MAFTINGAESYFARLRRMIRGQYHRVGVDRLGSYAVHSAWLEDHRRQSKGALVAQAIGNGLLYRPAKVLTFARRYPRAGVPFGEADKSVRRAAARKQKTPINERQKTSQVRIPLADMRACSQHDSRPEQGAEARNPFEDELVQAWCSQCGPWSFHRDGLPAVEPAQPFPPAKAPQPRPKARRSVSASVANVSALAARFAAAL